MATWHTLNTRFKYQAWTPFGHEKAVLSLQWTTDNENVTVHGRLVINDKVQTSSILATLPLGKPRGQQIEQMLTSGQFDPAWLQAKQWADSLIK